MQTTRRAAGLGLLAYGIGTPLAFISIGAPGGNYSEQTVVDYVARGHWVAAFVLAYVGAFASLGLLVFANRMRHEVRAAGNVLWALAVAATATAVVGWFLVGGISVAFAEGGTALTTIPHPIVYMASEMSNLIAVCASAFFVGAVALVLARHADLPRALRGPTYVAGVCGLVAALFFPVFLFWLWAIVLGAWTVRSGARRAEPVPAQAQLA